jgi:hypothetical protein
LCRRVPQPTMVACRQKGMAMGAAPNWWQASDGKWYPPEQHPSYRPPPPRSSKARTTAVRGFSPVRQSARYLLRYLAIVGVGLAILMFFSHSSVTYIAQQVDSNGYATGSTISTGAGCSSPWNRLTSHYDSFGAGTPVQEQNRQALRGVCSNATVGREHFGWTLLAVSTVGLMLSFVRRRRGLS